MKRKNVITSMVDQLKATALNLYGNTFCKTPALEKLARNEVVYENAFTPHPLCVTARTSIWTSQYSHSHVITNNEELMSSRNRHAFHIWKEAGYHTALIGKNHCFPESELKYFDTWCEIEHEGFPNGVKTKGMDWVRPINAVEKAHTVRKNMPRLSPRIECAVTNYPINDYSTALVSQQTIEFLKRVQNESFSLWLSIPDPHNPYEVHKKYVENFPKEEIILPPWDSRELENKPERNKVLYEMLGIDKEDEADIYKVLRVYYGMVRFIDDEIGKILEALKLYNLIKDTIIVFCSDHGDFVGEHRMMGKGGLFYDCLTHVPLIISCPSIMPQGISDKSMVSLIDIVPTLLYLQELEIPKSMQGKLLPTVTNAEPRSEVFDEYGSGGPPFTYKDLKKFAKPYGRHTIKETLKWREAEGRRKMIRTKEWKYVTDPMGDKDELYNLVTDPWELNNVAALHENKDIIASLTKRLLEWSIMTESIY